MMVDRPRSRCISVKPTLNLALAETANPVVPERRDDVPLDNEGVVVERPGPDPLVLGITQARQPRAEPFRERPG